MTGGENYANSARAAAVQNVKQGDRQLSPNSAVYRPLYVDSAVAGSGTRVENAVFDSTTGNRTFRDETCALIEGWNLAPARRSTRPRSRPKSSRNFG